MPGQFERLEQWRNELEARVNSLVGELPDSQAVSDLRGQVQRLDQRVAELEQRLSNPEGSNSGRPNLAGQANPEQLSKLEE
jgi:BMFP domain-containing protein YqiC